MKIQALLLATSLLFVSAQAAVVAEWNFGTSGNFEGWDTVSLNVTGLEVSAGFLSGVATNNDPQLRNTELSLTVGSGETWGKVIFRVRETEDIDNNVSTNDFASTITFDPTGLVVQFNGSAAAGFQYSSGFTAVDSGSGFYTISLDISALPAATTISSFRVDPIGGASSNSNSQTQGNLFEVDFIQVTSVPEPGAALLGGLGLLRLLRRRR